MIPLIDTEKEFDSIPYNLMKDTSLNNINNNIWGQIGGNIKKSKRIIKCKVQDCGYLYLRRERNEVDIKHPQASKVK